MNVLIYWNNNKLIYATLAQRVLCIPTTNISVKHSLSNSGGTITSHYARLNRSKVNQLLFRR